MTIQQAQTQYKTAEQENLNEGAICFILDKRGKKVMCELSHYTPHGRGYLWEIKPDASGKRKKHRRSKDKIFLLSNTDENKTEQVEFSNNPHSTDSNAAVLAAQKFIEEQQERERKAQSIKDSFSIARRFDILESLTRLTATGKRNALVITGEGGLGKTYTVNKILKELNLVEHNLNRDDNNASEDDEDFIQGAHDTDDNDGDADYIFIKGYSTARGLYETLWNHRNKLIIFDDCDEVLSDKTARNILKAALDSYEKRIISWNSAGAIGGDVPKQFEFFGQVIFISNMGKNKMDKAVLTRCSKVDVSMTPDEKIERMTYIINTGNYMPNVPQTLQLEALELLSKHKFVDGLSMRSLEEVIVYRVNEPEQWEMLSEYSLYS